MSKVLNLYPFLSTHPSERSIRAAWHVGGKFAMCDGRLVSKRDVDDELAGYTHVKITDPRTGHTAIIILERTDEKPAPSETALRSGERAHPEGESRRREDVRVHRAGEALHADGKFEQAALTILASMMASAAHADTPVLTLVDKSVAAAATLMHKIYGND